MMEGVLQKQQGLISTLSERTATCVDAQKHLRAEARQVTELQAQMQRLHQREGSLHEALRTLTVEKQAAQGAAMGAAAALAQMRAEVEEARGGRTGAEWEAIATESERAAKEWEGKVLQEAERATQLQDHLVARTAECDLLRRSLQAVAQNKVPEMMPPPCDGPARAPCPTAPVDVPTTPVESRATLHEAMRSVSRQPRGGDENCEGETPQRKMEGFGAVMNGRLSPALSHEKRNLDQAAILVLVE
jgi:hypothetical protein